MLIFLLLCVATTTVQSAVLDTPGTRWTQTLPAGMQRGNAVVADGTVRLVATTAVGSLHVLNLQQGNITINYDPTELDALSCTSGVALVDDLAVYSVYNAAQDTSRVIALHMEQGSVEWMVTVEGQTVGTPLVGESGIYVVHNTQAGGRVSVVVDSSVVTSFPSETSVAPLGPGSLQTVQGRDVVAVAVNREEGFSEDGSLYMLVQEEPQDAESQFSYRWTLASATVRSAVAAPTLTANMEVFLGQQGSLLSAWVGRRDLSEVFSGDDDNVVPRWGVIIEEDEDDSDAPIYASPKVTSDGLFLLAAGAGPGVYCMRAEERRETVWSEPTTDTVVASPVLCEVGEDRDEYAAYFMERSGVLRSYRIYDEGDPLIWQQNVCGEDCQGVEADFAVIESGNILYYGDTAGRITAVNVATFATEAPSVAPSLAPSEMPSLAPVEPSASPTLAPSSSPSLSPSARPSLRPSIAPTEAPSVAPTETESVVEDETNDETQAPTVTAGNSTDDKDVGDDGETSDRDVTGIGGDPPGSSGNDILSGSSLIYIGAAAGGLFFFSVLGAILICCQRKRAAASKNKQSDLKKVEDTKKWNDEKDAYEKACKEAEKETLTEILGSPDEKSNHDDVPNGVATTPATALTAIAETPDDLHEKVKTGLDEELGEEIGFEMSVTGDSPEHPRSVLPKNLSKRFASSPTYSNSVPEFTQTAPEAEIKQRASFDSAVVAPSVGGETVPGASNTGLSDVQSTGEDTASLSKDSTPPRGNGVNAAGILQDMVRRENTKEPQGVPSSPEDEEVAAVTTGVADSHQIYSDDEEEPGRIQAGKRKTAPRPVAEERPRAASPSFSDMLSVDDSLYYDDSTIATHSKKDRPDDESTFASFGLGSLFGASRGTKSPEPQSTPAPEPAQESPKTTVTNGSPKNNSQVAPLGGQSEGASRMAALTEQGGPRAAQLPQPAPASPPASPGTDTRVVKALQEPIAALAVPPPQAGPPRSAAIQNSSSGRYDIDSGKVNRELSHAGVSVRSGRSRAGLFTRRHAPLSAKRGMEMSDTVATTPEITQEGGTVSEVEELTSAVPTKKSTRFEDSAVEESASEESKKVDPKEDAWNSFLSELSKAEETFFNPAKLLYGDSDAPRSHSRSPSPPPPPPPRD